MDVKVINFKEGKDKDSVEYKVKGLNLEQLEFLEKNLEEEVSINKEENYLILKAFFNHEIYPFQSEESKYKLDDFIANQEIEMNLYLSSLLEDF